MPKKPNRRGEPVSWKGLEFAEIQSELINNPTAYGHVSGDDPLWLDKILDGVVAPDQIIRPVSPNN